VCKEYELQEHHVKLLTAASEAWDRLQQAREALQQHGLVYVDARGVPHSRPEVAVERDSRIAFARIVRELRLDGTGLPDDAGRTPRLPQHGRAPNGRA
jgi:phage terminase small subunit